MGNDKKRKEINKKEVRNIAAAGVVGGLAGAGQGAGTVAFNNYDKYNKVKKAYINKHIDEYMKRGLSKKEAYKVILEEFSKKKIELNKIIPDYKGPNKYRLADAYKAKAIHEMPYKVIGGAMAGVPLGMLAYGQISNLAENFTKKASYNMVYFEKVTNNK